MMIPPAPPPPPCRVSNSAAVPAPAAPRAAQIQGNLLLGRATGTWGGCGAGSGPGTWAAATCGPRVEVGINLSCTTVVTPGNTSRVTR